MVCRTGCALVLFGIALLIVASALYGIFSVHS
jgi:hypothetical protein